MRIMKKNLKQIVFLLTGCLSIMLTAAVFQSCGDEEDEAPAPTIGSFSPAGGHKDTNVTILGTNFTEEATVHFNGVEAEVTFVSATELQAKAPARSGEGKITVTANGKEAESEDPFLYEFTTMVTEIGAGAGLQEPKGIAVDANGVIYVADKTLQKIIKITPNGTWSDFATNLALPEQLDIDDENNVYLADQELYKVVKFTPNGTPSDITSEAGYYNGVVVDAEDVYVAGYYDSGQEIRKITNGSETMVATDAVGYLDIDSQNNIYVALENIIPGTIQKIAPGTAPIVFAENMKNQVIAVDMDDNVLGIDATTGFIQKISPAGIKSTLTEVRSFAGAAAMTMDTQGSIYITDRVEDIIYKVSTE